MLSVVVWSGSSSYSLEKVGLALVKTACTANSTSSVCTMDMFHTACKRVDRQTE